MSELAWSSDMLQTRVAPVGVAQYVETRIRHAAKELKWKFSRTKDVWYEDERVSLKPRELRDIEEYTGVRYGRAEVREIGDIIARADALLVGPEADFYRPFVAGLRAFFGAVDGPGTGRDGDAK